MENGDQFKIGQLYGKLDGISIEMQNIKQDSTRELKELKAANQEEHKEIKDKLEDLSNWKLKTIGFVSGIWFVLTGALILISKLFNL